MHRWVSAKLATYPYLSPLPGWKREGDGKEGEGREKRKGKGSNGKRQGRKQEGRERKEREGRIRRFGAWNTAEIQQFSPNFESDGFLFPTTWLMRAKYGNIMACSDTHSLCLYATCYLEQSILQPLGGEKKQTWPYFELHFVYSNAFIAVVSTNCTIQKHNKLTNKQRIDIELFCLPFPASGSMWCSPTELSIVKEEVCIILHLQNVLASDIQFPNKGCRKYGRKCILNFNRIGTHTYKHTQPFYGSMDFVRDNPGEPAPEETFTSGKTKFGT